MNYNAVGAVDPESQRVIMTWFGSLLVNDPPADWLAHLPGAQAEANGNFLLIDVPEAAMTQGSFLRQTRPRPRALPRFATVPRQDGRVHLRCTDTGTGGQALLDHLLCAIPNGTFEINRETPSDWETFLLLEVQQYQNVRRLLMDGGRFFPGPHKLVATMGLGHVMVAGDHLIDIARNLDALKQSEPDIRLTTTTGTQLSIGS